MTLLSHPNTREVCLCERVWEQQTSMRLGLLGLWVLVLKRAFPVSLNVFWVARCLCDIKVFSGGFWREIGKNCTGVWPLVSRIPLPLQTRAVSSLRPSLLCTDTSGWSRQDSVDWGSSWITSIEQQENLLLQTTWIRIAMGGAWESLLQRVVLLLFTNTGNYWPKGRLNGEKLMFPL